MSDVMITVKEAAKKVRKYVEHDATEDLTTMIGVRINANSCQYTIVDPQHFIHMVDSVAHESGEEYAVRYSKVPPGLGEKEWEHEFILYLVPGVPEFIKELVARKGE